LDVVASPPKKLAPPVEGLVSATLAEEPSNPPVVSEVVAPPKMLLSLSTPGYCCCCFVSNRDEVPVAKAGMFAVEVNKEDGAVVAGPFASPTPLAALVEVAFCANAVEGCKVEGCF